MNYYFRLNERIEILRTGLWCLNTKEGVGKLLEISQLQKQYGKQTVLNTINLSISQGSCYGLIGPNGAGKSTLMKILVGILDAYSGEILFEGQPLKASSLDFKKKIGYVPQDIVLNDTLSAMDNLLFFGSIYGLSKKESRTRIDEVLELVGLKDRAKDPIKNFSGGMKRRINIGCALLHDPQFIVMDEPTVGVDPQSRNYIFELILNLKKEGKTILYSSHYMEEIETLCDAVSLIDHGEIIEQGPVSEILSKHSIGAIYVEGDIRFESLQSYGTVHERDSGFVIETREPLSVLSELSADFKNDHTSIQRLEIATRTLEDVFLQLTGRTLRD